MNVCESTTKLTLKKASSHSYVLMKSANRYLIKETCLRYWMKMTCRNTWTLHSISWLIINKICLGVQQPIATTLLCGKRTMITSLSVPNVKSITASIAECSFTRVKLAKNTKSVLAWTRMMKSFWSLLKEKNTNNALSANIGLKRLSDATIWGADAEKNFVTNVVE